MATTKLIAAPAVLLLGCLGRAGAQETRVRSFTIYDAARKVWHQSWVTNRGQLLVTEGGVQGDRMVLTGTDRAADGTPRQIRGVCVRVEGGGRETAETSDDGGRTWKPRFDIVFRPRRP